MVVSRALPARCSFWVRLSCSPVKLVSNSQSTVSGMPSMDPHIHQGPWLLNFKREADAMFVRANGPVHREGIHPGRSAGASAAPATARAAASAARGPEDSN